MEDWWRSNDKLCMMRHYRLEKHVLFITGEKNSRTGQMFHTPSPPPKKKRKINSPFHGSWKVTKLLHETEAKVVQVETIGFFLMIIISTSLRARRH